MERFKSFILKVLFPPVWLVVLLVPVSAAMLIYVFGFGSQSSPAAIASYVISAYSLTVLCCKMPDIIKKIKALVYCSNKAVNYISDSELRARVSLNSALVINLCYSIFKTVAGIVYKSFWFGAEAEYYIFLSLMRYWLIRSDAKHGNNPERLWKSYRLCGWLLLLLNIIMSFIMAQVVFRDESYRYPGVIIYASAAYTFYRITVSVIQTVKTRSNGNPVLSASKRLNLSASLMSLFALQTAMLSQFSGESEMSNRITNGATAAAVCVAVMVIAIMMIFKSKKELTNLKHNVSK